MNLSSPLYVTDAQDGKLMLGGIFKMHDQVGFPVDCSIDHCRENDHLIDWLEALCDCWLNDCLKFDSFVRQAESCLNAKVEDKWKETCRLVLNKFPKMMKTDLPINTACRYILAKKKLHSWKD